MEAAIHPSAGRFRPGVERLMDLHRRALAAAREVLESNAAEPQVVDTAKRLLEEEKRLQRTAMLLNDTFRDNQAATPDR